MIDSKDTELQVLASISRSLPRIKGSGRLARAIQRFYSRKAGRPRVVADVLDFRMELDPCESIDGFLLFAPQLFDFREFSIIKSLLQPGETFLDAGANIGIYSLVASGCVGPKGRVLAVEASSFNASCLRKNCELSKASNVTCLQVGLSDRVEKLELSCSDYGNRSGNSFLKKSSVTESVSCMPLADVLNSAGAPVVHGAKFDIEGFEHKVLEPYLRTANKSTLPRFFIFEHNRALVERSGGDVRKLLAENGYDVKLITDQNYLATRIG